ncbi:MAG: DUF4071 domain-containing protein [Alphaproteobacteria bacterium]|nr:MAG: DUF4071 domain-containing protein [Alphaproteobacteria bacterium]
MTQPALKPLCFVLMPFGNKLSATGATVDFDAVYQDVFRPAIEAAGLEPLRADEELAGGVIHRAMFERLILCDYALADLTTANANVFYELGVRHATKRHTTVLTFAKDQGQLPFDVASLRATPYSLGADGAPSDVAAARAALTERLRAAQEPSVDSPLYQLIDSYPDLGHTSTDTFRDRVRYAQGAKDALATARRKGMDAVRAVEAEFAAPLATVDPAVLIDLMLSYRAVSAWADMVRVADAMTRPLATSVMVQEQLALALNRMGERDRAENVIEALIARRGPSSESYGILGRIRKDQWEDAHKAGQSLKAKGLLERAIAAYRLGFEADWRDAYPGINALTLMTLHGGMESDIQALVPVVRYAVERKIAAGRPDDWDHATLVELAVIAADRTRAANALAAALACQTEPWMRETTARNLRLLRNAPDREAETGWVDELIGELG